MFDHDLMFFKPEFCNFLHLRLVIKQVISPLQVQYKSVIARTAGLEKISGISDSSSFSHRVISDFKCYIRVITDFAPYPIAL